MYCLKCGSETLEEKIFCEECLVKAQMYPVKPGTPIQLPKPETFAPRKAPSAKRPVSAEEQVEELKKSNRRLKLLLLLTTVALALCLGIVFNII